jgi:hypothetical protein
MHGAQEALGQTVTRLTGRNRNFAIARFRNHILAATRVGLARYNFFYMPRYEVSSLKSGCGAATEGGAPTPASDFCESKADGASVPAATILLS